MTITNNVFIVSQDNEFTQLSNSLINDPKLSWKAKGIYAYMRCKASLAGWTLNKKDVLHHAKDRKKSLTAGLKELTRANYLMIGSSRDRLGRFQGSIWLLFNKPYNPKDLAEMINKAETLLNVTFATTYIPKSPKRELPEKGSTEKGYLISNTNISNTDGNNKEKEKDILSDLSDIPYKDIIEFFNSSLFKNYRLNGNKTRRLIKARWQEGHRLADFKRVIEKKKRCWLGDAKMEQYLRPETLFGTKFESYLNEYEEIKEEETILEQNYEALIKGNSRALSSGD